jgi:hypothetical protein
MAGKATRVIVGLTYLALAVSSRDLVPAALYLAAAATRQLGALVLPHVIGGACSAWMAVHGEPHHMLAVVAAALIDAGVALRYLIIPVLLAATSYWYSTKLAELVAQVQGYTGPAVRTALGVLVVLGISPLVYVMFSLIAAGRLRETILVLALALLLLALPALDVERLAFLPLLASLATLLATRRKSGTY